MKPIKHILVLPLIWLVYLQVRLLGDQGGFSTPVGGRGGGGVSMMEDEDDGVEDTM